MTISYLALWDVDHTLVETGSVGSAAFRAGFEAATGIEMQEMADPSGLTEPEIFQRTLRLHHIDDPGDYFGVFERVQAEYYAEHAGDMLERGRALPGAELALATIADHPRVIQSVLTGNTRTAAQTKLRIFGLDRYIDFELGAYGTDDAVRARLIDIARERVAEQTGERFDATTTVLIGDTPLDVEAGREGGARVIAVATGRSSVAELRATAADTVLADLTGTNALLTAITSPP